MAVWSLADLHLSFGVPDKKMDVFGRRWIGHTQKVQDNWKKVVQEDDLVLIPGDISWAMQLDDVKPDLEWIHSLPGTKVMLKGNHDYWWSSISKVEKILPPSIHLIQNNAFLWNDIAIGGGRLWDTPEYSFREYIEYVENDRSKTLTGTEVDPVEIEKIFRRELDRLELSLKCLNKSAKIRIAMTHYPPISATLQPSRASAILEKYHINICVFGHLHNVRQDALAFGEKNGVRYYLTACDYLDCMPLKILG